MAMINGFLRKTYASFPLTGDEVSVFKVSYGYFCQVDLTD